MPGTVIFSKQSTIFKVLCIVLAVLGFGLCAEVPVQASSLSDFSFSPLSDSDISYSSPQCFGTMVASEIISSNGIVYDLNHSGTNPVYDLDYSLLGNSFYLKYEGDFSLVETINIGSSASFSSIFGYFNESFSLVFSNQSLVYPRLSIEDFSFSSSVENTDQYIAKESSSTTSCILRNRSRISEFTFVTQNIRNTINFHGSCIVRFDVDESTFSSVYNSAMRQNINLTIDSFSRSNYFYYSEYTDREILNVLDTKLYNIWISENLIYQQLRDTANQNSIADNIQSNAAIAESQANRLYDSFVNDSSVVSGNLDSTSQSYAAAESAAEVAINGAVPSYESDLQQIENFNGTGFFNGQLEAASFWKNLGNYILDSNNLGYISTGLIIVTIVTLFVFLLRL